MARRITTVLALLLSTWSTTVAAGPCEAARRGTYLSNVCWLIEDHTRHMIVRSHVTDADREKCTATVDQSFWRERMNDERTIHFGRSDGNLTVEHRTTSDGKVLTCWTLYGEAITTDSNESTDKARVCGTQTSHRRVENAMRNLFSEYCPVEEPEF